MIIELTSPRTTALNQTVQFSPITTSPTTVEFSASQQLSPKVGEIPFTGFINGILYSFKR